MNDLYYSLRYRHILSDPALDREYPLTKISCSDVKQIRKSKKPVFIYKITVENNMTEYWYTEVPSNFSLIARKWCPHSCATCDILGTKEGMDCLSYFSIEKSLLIEQFDFIEEAFVVINTTHRSVKLLKCKRYFREENKVVKTISATERKNNAIKLAQYLNPSIENFFDLKEFEKKNLNPFEK